MVVLGSKTIMTSAGITWVPFPAGLGLFSVLAVKREGVQYDKVAGADLNNGNNRQCTLDGIRRRIKFPDAMPFIDGEKVFVIYKVLV